MSDLACEAYDILESTLTEGDREELKEIYRKVSSQIYWKQVLDNAFPILVDMAEEITETLVMAKEGGPWGKVPNEDVNLFVEEDPKYMARRQALILLLAKKLLGGLKTRTNQKARDIRILSPIEELDLQDVIDQDGETEEQTSSVDDSVEVAASLERKEVDISLEGKCLHDGRHVRTTVQRRRKNKDNYLELYCRDCRKIVKSTLYRTSGEAPKKVCSHPNSEWVGGKEGQEAICSEPTCQALIEDPEIYKWASVGLEPFGDDPSQDEVITLCSEY